VPGYRLTVLDDADDVARASGWLHEIAKANALPVDLLFRIDLCLAEVVTNVVSYAFSEASVRHRIELGLQLDGGWAVLTVSDAGCAFNPLDAPEPPHPTRLEDAPIGGLGIHLIRQYAEECTYRRVGDRNELTMRWRIAPLEARP
jgi:sigma-B regulation protein RsbU (phosphoserine phosphatase)